MDTGIDSEECAKMKVRILEILQTYCVSVNELLANAEQVYKFIGLP